jgi:Ca2+-binding RTX toxin-like protein
MTTRIMLQLAVFALVVLVLASVLTASAAANIVPVSRADDLSIGARKADQLKPSQCTMTLTNIVNCPAAGGACTGTDNNDLILGSPLADDIRGGKGDDCILGGGGDDFMRGDQGTDVCIGGPGTDTFHNSCETQIQ